MWTRDPDRAGFALDFVLERSGVVDVPRPPPPLSFPDRTASDLRLAAAIIAEETGDYAHDMARLYAVDDLVSAAADLACLAAAIQVLHRRRRQLAQ